jgi:thioredoxin reductase (NADPH)
MVKNIYSKGTPHHKIKHYDLVILGAGPAGLTAAIYAARYNLSVAVIGKSIGGTANLAAEVHNWPGFSGSGVELMKRFYEQAIGEGARILEAEVDKVEKDNDGFVLNIKDKEIHGKAIIIALGTEQRKLDLKGEKEFVGKGVSYCFACDGPNFKGKVVAVIGGADSAAKAALSLANIAKKVYIIYRRNEMRCEPASFEQIKKNKKIKICYNSIITKISGKDALEKIYIEQDEENGMNRFSLDVKGLFIEIGATPVQEVIKQLGIKTNSNYLSVDDKMKTSVAGVFSAGDSTSGHLKQIVTAAGQGAIAAKSAYDYLRFEYKNK